ncbi:hypothetical protein RJ639_019370 [Escallonia herrerae]|uniref:TF-B3 domain-containing protein n=1 Tax=Escallonia herrerae TaxID=1293975 RepID=A0AA89AGH3_9ASTE|nr:hypothetical protein RJ639_019370 [Escallonia herrerae]
MVEPRRKISYSDKKPQFFKIFVPDQCSEQLRIPPAFVKHFKSGLPLMFKLTSPAKKSWAVDVNKIDDYLYFQKGWSKFVEDNSLEAGDFLIFCFDGNSSFYVSIFGKNNCQKEVATTSMESDQTLLRLQGNRQASEPSGKLDYRAIEWKGRDS